MRKRSKLNSLLLRGTVTKKIPLLKMSPQKNPLRSLMDRALRKSPRLLRASQMRRMKRQNRVIRKKRNQKLLRRKVRKLELKSPKRLLMTRTKKNKPKMLDLKM
jgi:hypothetical protein